MGTEQKKIFLQRLSDSYYIEGNEEIRKFFLKELQEDLDKLKNEKFKDNDELLEKLEELSLFIYPISKEALVMIEKIYLSDSIPTKDQITQFGPIPGKTHEEVLVKCVELLGQIKYLESEEVIELLARYSNHESSVVREKSLEIVGQFCKYDFQALNKIRFLPQNKFLNSIKAWSKSKNEKYLIFLSTGLKSILSPDFEGATWRDFQTVTFHSGGLKADDEIKNIREEAINFLKKLYLQLTNPADQIVVIQTLNAATYDSQHGGDMRDLVKENTKSILKFYNEKVIPNAQFEILSELEDKVTWGENQFQEDNIEEFKVFWKLLKANKEYQIYRVLVGYDRKFRKDLEFGETEEFRKEKVYEYLKSIKEATESKWKNRIIAFAETQKTLSDIGKFYYFNELLKLIGKKKPDLALKLLEVNRLKEFIGVLIAGLFESNKRKEAEKIINQWISKGKNLLSIAYALRRNPLIEISTAKSLFSKIKTRRDPKEKKDVLYNLLLTIGFENLEEKEFFLELIKELTKINFYGWANWFYGEKDTKTIFNTLNEKEWDIILKGFLEIDDINYHEEYVLKILTSNYPQKLVEFFGKRIQREERKRKENWKYSAIPTRPSHLFDIAKEKEKEIVDAIWLWFNKKSNWKAAILLHALYPGLTEGYLEEKMNEVIDEGSIAKWNKYIAPIFQWYQGGMLKKLVIRTVKKLPKNKKIWTHCKCFLGNTGMVSGSVGEAITANAYRAKIKTLDEDVDSWNLKDKKEKEFVSEYRKYLEQNVEIEEKRHEEDMEKLRRKYQ